MIRYTHFTLPYMSNMSDITAIIEEFCLLHRNFTRSPLVFKKFIYFHYKIATVGNCYRKEEQDAAFSANRFFFSMAMMLAFIVSGLLSVKHTMYLIMGLIALAAVSMMLFEVVVRREQQVASATSADDQQSKAEIDSSVI